MDRFLVYDMFGHRLLVVVTIMILCFKFLVFLIMMWFPLSMFSAFGSLNMAGKVVLLAL